MRPLSDRAFNQRRATIVARLDRLGRLDLRDFGERRPVRAVRIDLAAPGQIDNPALVDDARFRYEEWFRRSGREWVRVGYNYNYFDLARGGWRGYHLHPLPGSEEPVPHAKCVLADGTGTQRHYEAHELELLAAHDEFEAQYASGRPIECRGLRPID